MSWRDLVRSVLFRCVAEAWVETDRTSRRQWGWRLRNGKGSVVRRLNERHDDPDGAFDAGVRYFGRWSLNRGGHADTGRRPRSGDAR